jgi:hypothetical protein
MEQVREETANSPLLTLHEAIQVFVCEMPVAHGKKLSFFRGALPDVRIVSQLPVVFA